MDFEKLGVFYLGRVLDPASREPTGELLLQDARDLTSHAVIVGMTGSGKTGLGLALLEEAALDGVPALAIDPKVSGLAVVWHCRACERTTRSVTATSRLMTRSEPRTQSRSLRGSNYPRTERRCNPAGGSRERRTAA